jgi:hypothetical protein
MADAKIRARVLKPYLASYITYLSRDQPVVALVTEIQTLNPLV